MGKQQRLTDSHTEVGLHKITQKAKRKKIHNRIAAFLSLSRNCGNAKKNLLSQFCVSAGRMSKAD